MAQQVKALVARPDDLNSVPETQSRELVQQVVLCPPHVHSNMHGPQVNKINMKQHNNNNNLKIKKVW